MGNQNSSNSREIELSYLQKFIDYINIVNEEEKIELEYRMMIQDVRDLKENPQEAVRKILMDKQERLAKKKNELDAIRELKDSDTCMRQEIEKLLHRRAALLNITLTPTIDEKIRRVTERIPMPPPLLTMDNSPFPMLTITQPPPPPPPPSSSNSL